MVALDEQELLRRLPSDEDVFWSYGNLIALIYSSGVVIG